MKEKVLSRYPNAQDGVVLTGRCMEKLTGSHGFDPERTLLATSVCSDEIIRSATNFRDYMGIVTPFQLGGLAGYPFTGLTGMRAFASHIPDNGGAIFLYGPHIGISSEGRVGFTRRTGQVADSACCGALHASLASFRQEENNFADPELDYQLWKLEMELLPDAGRLVGETEPLVAVTDRLYELIDERIVQLLEIASKSFVGVKVALVGGVIINTDHGYPDWFDLRKLEVIGKGGERESVSF